MPPSSAGGSSTNPPPSAPAQMSSSTGTVSYPQLNTNFHDDDFDDEWTDEDEEVAVSI